MRARLSGVRYLLVLWVLLAVVSVSAAAEVRYIYDDLNRLIGVVDPSGEAVEYTYDAVGMGDYGIRDPLPIDQLLLFSPTMLGGPRPDALPLFVRTRRPASSSTSLCAEPRGVRLLGGSAVR